MAKVAANAPRLKAETFSFSQLRFIWLSLSKDLTVNRNKDRNKTKIDKGSRKLISRLPVELSFST